MAEDSSKSAPERAIEENVLLPRRDDGTPFKFLIVEEEGLIALDLAARLTDWGAESVIAPTIRSALRDLAGVRPDVVLLDVRLPDGDGIELVARMQELSDAAIIFVTANRSPGTLRRIQFLCDFPVVSKPVDYRELRQAIRQVLTGRSETRANESIAASREDGETIALPRSSDGTPLKCLVVENEAPTAIRIADTLKGWGASSEIAPTIAVALRRVAEVQPDVVLLEVELPDGSGLELAAKLQDLSRSAVVFVTRKTDSETLRRIRFLGYFPVVPKPVDFRQLRHTIQDVLAG